MTQWETQTMEEAARNTQWEELNSTTDEQEEKEPFDLYRTVDHLHDGLEFLYNAINNIQYAVDDAEGHLFAGKLGGSLITLQNVDKVLQGLEKEIHEELIRRESESA